MEKHMAQFQSQLNNQLSILLDQLEKNLVDHYRTKKYSEKEAKKSVFNQLKQFNRQKLHTLEFYSKILDWCDEIKPEDDLYPVLKEFLKCHRNTFKERINAYQQKCYMAIKKQDLQINCLKDECQSSLQRINREIVKHQSSIYQMRDVTKRFETCFTSTGFTRPKHDWPWRGILQEIKPLLASSDVIKGSKKTLPHPIDLVLQDQELILARLDANIQQYCIKLNQEGWARRVLNFFSFYHRRRLRALKAYGKIVSSGDTTKVKFEKLVAWSKEKMSVREFQSKKCTSRFYYHCLIPFYEDHEQFQFETMSAVNKKFKNKNQLLINKMSNSIILYNNNIELLNNFVSAFLSEALAIKRGLSELLTLASKKIGEKQMSLNEWWNILEKISYVRMIDECAPQYRSKQEAFELVRQLLILESGYTHEKMQAIKQKVKTLSIQGQSIIYGTLDTMGKNIMKYNCRNNLFFNATNVKKMIDELGTSEQSSAMNDISANKNKNIDPDLLGRELVESLDAVLESGDLKKKLERWSDAIQKKAYLSEQDDMLARTMYTKEIRSAIDEASDIHTFKGNMLEKFVDRVIASALNVGSSENRFFSSANVFPKLGLPNTSLLISIYGSNAQFDQWSKVHRIRVESQLSSKYLSECPRRI